jgi:hypothetical protein
MTQTVVTLDFSKLLGFRIGSGANPAKLGAKVGGKAGIKA